MKRLFSIMILVLSVAFLLSACGGGGGGGGGAQLPPPAANLSGTWDWSGTVNTNSCRATPYSDTSWSGIIDHPAESNTFTLTSLTQNFVLTSAQGTISGSSITLSASYADNGGTSSFTFSGTLDSSHTTIDGTSTWTWIKDGGSSQCNGTTHVIAMMRMAK